MKFTTLLPVADNDGRKFPREQMLDIIVRLGTQFGGASQEGFVRGLWLDAGRMYHDKSIRVSVVCDNSRLEEARQAVIAIGRELGQLVMYFEVRDYDGVQFIQIE